MFLLSRQQQGLISPEEIPTNVTLYCDYCDKEFVRKKWLVLKSDEKFGGRVYCSRQCFGKCRPNRYDKFMYCNNCTKWIPRKDAVFKPKGSLNYYRSSNFPKNSILFKSKLYDFNGKVQNAGEDMGTSAQNHQTYTLKKDNYYCPVCITGKLRNNSKKSRLNHKRKIIKRL